MSDKEKMVIALGFFDGVHLGHGALLSHTVGTAGRMGLRSCALTFDTHPDSSITGHKTPLINSSVDRANLMRGLYGVEEVIFIHFDRELMRMRWDNFVKDILIGRFHAAHVVAGHDYQFGYRGEGNPERLCALCGQLGIGCDIIPRVERDGITVSSTYIRRLIAQGDMERAAQFLGHPHVLSERVIHGMKLGSSIGVPTTNLRIPEGVQEPAWGVYITYTVIEGKRYPSVTNVGVKPTVQGAADVIVESFILDFYADLYGKMIGIEFISMLRPEVKFASLNELIEAIGKDQSAARAYFSERGDL